MIVVINEGVTVSTEHNKSLTEVAKTYFPKTPFVYITHRLNSYSVDPQIYFKTEKIENLIGFAVVSQNYQAKLNAQIEKMFFTKPFLIFSEIEDAVEWASQITKID